jgi:hypothetical protein
MSATGSNEFEMVEAMGNFSVANNELSGSLEALIRKNCKEEIALCTKLIISDTFCDIIEQIEEPKLIKMLNINGITREGLKSELMKPFGTSLNKSQQLKIAKKYFLTQNVSTSFLRSMASRVTSVPNIKKTTYSELEVNPLVIGLIFKRLGAIEKDGRGIIRSRVSTVVTTLHNLFTPQNQEEIDSLLHTADLENTRELMAQLHARQVSSDLERRLAALMSSGPAGLKGKKKAGKKGKSKKTRSKNGKGKKTNKKRRSGRKTKSLRV